MMYVGVTKSHRLVALVIGLLLGRASLGMAASKADDSGRVLLLVAKDVSPDEGLSTAVAGQLAEIDVSLEVALWVAPQGEMEQLVVADRQARATGAQVAVWEDRTSQTLFIYLPHNGRLKKRVLERDLSQRNETIGVMIRSVVELEAKGAIVDEEVLLPGDNVEGDGTGGTGSDGSSEEADGFKGSVRLAYGMRVTSRAHPLEHGLYLGLQFGGAKVFGVVSAALLTALNDRVDPFDVQSRRVPLGLGLGLLFYERRYWAPIASVGASLDLWSATTVRFDENSQEAGLGLSAWVCLLNRFYLNRLAWLVVGLKGELLLVKKRYLVENKGVLSEVGKRSRFLPHLFVGLEIPFE